MASESKQCGVVLTEDDFDSVCVQGGITPKCTPRPVRRFTWKNSEDMEVQVITYGATITSIKMPDQNGKTDDIAMGFKNMAGYFNPLNPYIGATIGRVASRITDAKFEIDGQVYEVSKNWRGHFLHGGFTGFDKINWDYIVRGNKVIMTYDSPDGEEGFPGSVLVSVTFEFTDEGELLMDFKAATTKPTFVSLTNHAYFNLAGHNKGAEELYNHVVTINADKITERNEDGIPSGKILPVAGTVYDLQIPRTLSDVMKETPNSEGYDENYCINKTSGQGSVFIARVTHPPTGRVLEVYSNQPGVQFYTSNNMPDEAKNCCPGTPPAETLEGKDGNYYKHGGFCLETQNYPDAPNHKNFPNAILYPGEDYVHTVVYRFYVQPKPPQKCACPNLQK